MLKAKCLVDTMSEVLACFACFTYYVTEHLASSLDFATTITVTYLNGTTGNYTTFVTPACRATCVGYQLNELTPAEPETRSISKLFGVCKLSLLEPISRPLTHVSLAVYFILVVRVICLSLELNVLDRIMRRFDEMAGGSQVTPVSGGGAKKAFGELSKDEFGEWLTTEGFEAYVEKCTAVGPKMLDDASITEAEIQEVVELPALVRRKLAAAIKRAVVEGVELGNGEGGGGQSEELRLPTSSKGAAAAMEHSSEVVHAAASVLDGVSLWFLFTSFVVATDSVAQGLGALQLGDVDSALELTYQNTHFLD